MPGVLHGRGSHAARPQDARDPIVAGAQIVSALQTVVSRVVNPLQPAVLSVTRFSAGTTYNVIPETAELRGTVRAFDEAVCQQIVAEMDRICAGVAEATRVAVSLSRAPNPYPPTINDPRETDFAESVLRAAFGDAGVQRGHEPTMAGEDFAFFSREVPGCYVLIGNGDSAPLHNPGYDFNDEATVLGVTYWARLVEAALPRAESDSG